MNNTLAVIFITLHCHVTSLELHLYTVFIVLIVQGIRM